MWPLSPLQAGLLFHARLAEAAVDAYAVQIAVALSGSVDRQRLHSAAQSLLDRYANLRVAFAATSAGENVQIVVDDVAVPWRVVDLRGEPDREAALTRVIDADQGESFDPEVAPLLRFTLVTVSDNRYVLLFSHHHVLLDGWSLPLVIRDLLVAYGAGGDMAALGPAESYRSYLSWLAERDRETSLQMWASALQGATPTLLAPREVNRQLTARIARVPLELPAQLGVALGELADELGVTMNTVVQVAWSLLLSQMTGQRDVVFGATVSGRPPEVPGIETMVGLFINTVPVRVRVESGETVAQLLSRVQAEQARLLDHHHLGLTDIAGAAGIGTLFDTAMVFESYPVDYDGLKAHAAALDGVSIDEVRSNDAPHYPLSVIVRAGSELAAEFTYLPAVFDEGQVSDVARRLRLVLGGLVEDPDAPVDDITVVDTAERALLLEQVNDTAAPVDPHATVVSLFEAQVSRTPTAVAVLDGTETVTYAALSARVNRLARVLIACGVGPEALVAVAVPRSVDMVVSVLAVLTAGGGYVPIDLDYPAARISQTLAAARPICVIGDIEAVVAGRWEVLDPRLVDIAVSDSAISDADRLAPLRPTNICDVIYTSGSTGEPKGVAVTHAGVVNQM
ncbi:MAG: AMP-binding protein, partial [Mycobacterium sp.]|nr:AMP-binding protein [Mycobacterium sp.]